MKKIVIGITGIISAIILFGMTMISASIFSTIIDGWDRRYGRFGTALLEVGTFPIVVSLIFFVIGAIFIINGVKEK